MEAMAQISMYSTLFIVCAVVAGIGLILAVLFFFLFDIPSAFAMMTGRAKEATIRKIMEKNAKTGEMRPATGLTGQMGAVTSNINMIVPPEPVQETSVLTQETAVLTHDEPEDGVGETHLLSGMRTPEAPAGFRFEVTENILIIHTEELI